MIPLKEDRVALQQENARDGKMREVVVERVRLPAEFIADFRLFLRPAKIPRR